MQEYFTELRGLTQDEDHIDSLALARFFDEWHSDGPPIDPSRLLALAPLTTDEAWCDETLRRLYELDVAEMMAWDFTSERSLVLACHIVADATELGEYGVALEFVRAVRLRLAFNEATALN